MRKARDKEVALLGVGQLEKLAGGYAQTAKMLQQLARGLRGLLDEVGGQGSAGNASKGHQTRKRGTGAKVGKRKPMSAAARKKIAAAAKARWAGKKAEESQPGEVA